MENTVRKDFIIGLTGGIGSGKSAVAQILGRLGAYIIDTDVVSKAVTAGGECYGRLKSAFPSCVVDGQLVRPLLKSLVFRDKDALKTLNSITHPYILAATLKEAEGRGVVAVQVPLLFESGFDRLCDVTVAVLAGQKLREQRVFARDNIPMGLIASIMAAQLTDDELRAKSDYIIENNGGIKELEENVERLYRQIKSRISCGKP